MRQNVETMTDQKIADHLTKNSGRKVTLHAVRKIRQNMGLKKASGRGYCKLKSKENTCEILKSDDNQINTKKHRKSIPILRIKND